MHGSQKNLDLPFLKRGGAYDINIRSLELVEQTKLVDYQGKIFVNQATAYMKYKEMEAFGAALWTRCPY